MSFGKHNQTVPLREIISPRPVTIQPVRVNPALLSGDKAQIDAFADEMIRREEQEAATKDGRHADGSLWAGGQCISPAPDSLSAWDLARYYDTHEFTGD